MSKYNNQLSIQQMQNAKQHFAIRKLSIGVVSVLLGLVFMGTTGHASTISNQNTSNNQVSLVTNNNDSQFQSTADFQKKVTPNTNTDPQAQVNNGCLDSVSSDNYGNLVVNGWHASNQYVDGTKHFIIALDASNNHELYRTQANVVSRPDVQNVYSKIAISRDSGFQASIPTEKLANVNSYKFVSRYTTLSNGEPASQSSDYYFPVVNSKAGYLDQFYIKGNKIVVNGWHADDQSAVKKTHMLILFDKTKGHEVARKIVNNLDSADVQRVIGNTILNTGHSRFQTTFTITPAMINDRLMLVSRYTDSDSVNHEGHYSDYWFNEHTLELRNNQAGYLDRFVVANNKLVVSGWHATDASTIMPYHYVILWDQTKGHEVGRYQVNTTSSVDVAKSGFGSIANAAQSRFNVDLDIPVSALGDKLQLISRYSDDQNHGEGNHVDQWFGNIVNLNDQAGWLDTLTEEDGVIKVTGWHAADLSAKYKHHFIILWDDTKNREVGRREVTNNSSNDVAQAYSEILDANNSRFATTFSIKEDYSNDLLKIISRYSDSANGEGNYSQFLMTNSALNIPLLKDSYLYDTQGNKYEIPTDSPEHVASLIANCVQKANFTTDLKKVELAAQYVSAFCDNDTYTMSGPYYSKPYGVFIAHQYSCAGATRALGLVLNDLGYKYHHVNENLYTHQWCKLIMDGKTGWADGQMGEANYGIHPAVSNGISEQN